MKDNSAILFQSFLQGALVSSSGMARTCHGVPELSLDTHTHIFNHSPLVHKF